MTPDVEHLFICLLDIFIASLGEIYFAHFSFGLFDFFIIECSLSGAQQIAAPTLPATAERSSNNT